MLGPIFHLELLLGSRRGRQHYLRWFVGGMLVLQLLGFYLAYDKAVTEWKVEHAGQVPPNAAGDFAGGFTQWLLMQQFFIILLAAPVFTAGAVTDEKTRGTLLYLFSADLTAWEILVGKLLGRSFELAVLLLTTLPFLCFIGVWGGVTPFALLAIALTLVGPMFALGAASLLMSVWVRQTRDAVVGLYAVGGLLYALWVGLIQLGGLGRPGSPLAAVKRLMTYFDPYYVAGPALSAADPKVVFAHLLGSWTAWGIVGGACFAVALWRLRAAYLKQLEHTGRSTLTDRLVPPRAAVNDEPLMWKERHVDGIAPLAVFKALPRWFALPGIVVGTVLLVIGLLAYASGQDYGTIFRWVFTLDVASLHDDTKIKDPGFAFLLLGVVVLVLGSLVVGIRCSGTVSGEREKQTWEALLLTPLETQSLIRNKLWGILGAALPYVLAYTIPAVMLATLMGPPQGWVLMSAAAALCLLLLAAFRKRLDSIGLFWAALSAATVLMFVSIPLTGGVLFLTLLCLVLTALAMFYMGAAGVYCSVRGSSSWRSLLATLGLGYVGGLVLWVVTSPITFIVGLIVWGFAEALASADAYLGTSVAGSFRIVTSNRVLIGFIASCIVLGATFLGVPWILIRKAEHHVGFMERIRIWREGDEPYLRTRRRGRVRRLKKAV